MIEKNMPLKERKKILNHLQGKTTTFTQLHVLKDAIEAHEKLEKIEHIVDDCDSGMISCEQLFLNLRIILEKE